MARRSPPPADERDTIDAAHQKIDFLTEEITTIEHDHPLFVLASPDARRLLTVPGVGMIIAAVFLAQTGTARGDITTGSPHRASWLATSVWTRACGNPAADLGTPAASATKARPPSDTSSSHPR